MRAVAQRVSSASVSVGDEQVASMDAGLLALVDGRAGALATPQNAALVLGALMAFLFLGPMGGLMAIVGAIAAVAVVVWLANRKIGGVTGDVLGAQQQVAEIAVLAAAAAVI